MAEVVVVVLRGTTNLPLRTSGSLSKEEASAGPVRQEEELLCLRLGLGQVEEDPYQADPLLEAALLYKVSTFSANPVFFFFALFVGF